MPNPGPLDSSLQLPPTAFPLDVFTSQPGLVRVHVPGWRGQECVCLCWPTLSPLTSSLYLLVSSIPQPMGRASVGRANSHPVPAPLGGKGGGLYSLGQACCCAGGGPAGRMEVICAGTGRWKFSVWGFSIFDPGRGIRQLPPMGEAGEEEEIQLIEHPEDREWSY